MTVSAAGGAFIVSRARTISPVSCAQYDARPAGHWHGETYRVLIATKAGRHCGRCSRPTQGPSAGPAGPAQDDAVDPARAEGTPAALKDDLARLIGQEQVCHRISDLVRYACDASPYRYLPQVVVLPRTVDDVRAILGYCVRTGRHATFRAGGTSLNGQSQSDDILIDVRRHWTGMAAEDGGARLRARPGTILGHANAVLRPLGRRLGPDPASADVATIGGVIANNAGGMRCTLERNAYHTVSSLTFVLASGTVIDTAAPGAEAAFAAAEPDLAAGLTQLRSQLLADDELTRRVGHKFGIRNTNGYALSALLDADTPLEIFRRLLVGSEGTLAFVAEAVIDTIPAPAMTTVSWVVLPSVSEAAALVPGLVGVGAEAVELMLAPALAAAAQAFPGSPAYWRGLDPGAAALLVEFGADSPAGLDAAEARAGGLVAGANLLHPRTSPVTRTRSSCTGRSATGCSASSDSSVPTAPPWLSRTCASRRPASPRAPRTSRNCCPSTASCRTPPGTPPTATCTSR